MKTLITLLASIIFVGVCHAQEAENRPVKIDTEDFSENLSVIKDYDLPESQVIAYDKVVYSPGKTRKLYIKSTDPSVVPYDRSATTITVMSGEEPACVIELKGYRSFNVNWVNEELLQVRKWPGRCIEIDEIIDVVNKTRIYKTGYNHCGIKE